MEKPSNKRKHSQSPKSINPTPLTSSLRKTQIFNELDKVIIAKISELKMKLKPLIEKDIYYIDNEIDIKNAEKISKDFENNVTSNVSNRSARDYFVIKYNNSLELLKFLKKRRNNTEWLEIRKVLEIIKKEHNDIYIKVFNILTEEITIAEVQTKQAIGRSHYLYWLQNKKNKAVDLTEAEKFLTEYKATDRESHDRMLQTVLTRGQKNPTIESINRTNAQNLEIQLLDIKKPKVSFAMQQACATTEDCTALENCINNLCILSEITEPSNEFMNNLMNNEKLKKDMLPYPNSLRKTRDLNNLLTGQKVRRI